ncbi:arginine repressor [Marinilactibacillus psychrotolerans]|uniref:Arginine repressor n=2 Tax=Marinilactibacillus psychrotolerans TaxID=191770 RepID=A0A511H3Q5_9LACT|nr:arginine repressor [Marinilactibacillus psychrotolerans]TLQ09237.1 arginine repressor [Marinilactibacillus psychrotolerans]SDD11673.1 transcriptional regulator, ArgR family [Marinilactibacillus psychrotolerans]SJN18498.1 Arginine pathway regulatory protein ArgR, repressor of arg regulon [Marinilactibacillus psychrotolerans 42ea]GEL68156.1 arginine repressor [Marinilactibacillus psychrotolerans]GEQ32131.1 arginine repressor [Marinilactibacillus psychrotolerans]
MKKKERHHLLRQLVQQETIQKQEDFVEILLNRGIDITQATISRDIKEMQLIKVPSQSGGYHYSLPPEMNFNISKKISRLMKDAFVSIDTQKEFVIIKTLPGNAFALGTLIETANYEEMFGCISGDNSVLIICRSEDQAEIFQRRMISFV